MFSLQLLQIKAVVLIYLTLSAYAEDSIRRITQQVWVDPQATVKPPTVLLIPDHDGTEGCSSDSRQVFSMIDGEVYQLITPTGATMCNVSDAGAVAMETLYGNETLAERQIPNPVIISFAVELTGGTLITGVVSLGTVAAVGAIAAAILLLWYGASKLFQSASETAAPPSKPRRTPIAEAEAVQPTIAVTGPPQPTPHNVIVSYSEPNTDVNSADNESQSMDSSIANSCVSMIEAGSSTATAGCCSVSMVGQDGYTYMSSVGVSAVDPTIPNFTCYQDES